MSRPVLRPGGMAPSVEAERAFAFPGRRYPRWPCDGGAIIHKHSRQFSRAKYKRLY
jgi:hypothetical protein